MKISNQLCIMNYVKVTVKFSLTLNFGNLIEFAMNFVN